MSVPAVVVAAATSGSGKTTVATGLMAALAGRGLAVAPFKVGPDYIDPGYHALAAGRPGRNLDPLLVGEPRVRGLYAHGAAGCDVAVVEGVMGLFDGRAGDPGAAEVTPVAPGSTAQVAALLGAPVVLVLDARGLSQSAAALIRGFATHDPATVVAGVVFNRVGSERHVAILTEAADSVGVPVVGALGRHPDLAVPSRHLGLVTAAEAGGGEDEAARAVARMGQVVAEGLDLDAVLALARAEVGHSRWDPVAEIEQAREVHRVDAPDGPVRIAVAGGRAFSFAYAEHTELLSAAGAEVVPVDPTVDEPLPEELDGIVLPGGFPEEHAEGLAGATRRRNDLARRVSEGMPVHAECAGLLYLCKALERTRDGAHTGEMLPMTGVLDAVGRFSSRLTLGYRDAVARQDSLLFREGERVTGHEFHRTVVEWSGAGPRSTPVTRPAWGWRDWKGAGVSEGAVGPTVHASYLHTHPAGAPHAVARLVAAAALHRDARRGVGRGAD